MQSENHTTTLLSLSIEDKARLQKFAPLFDIEFWQLDEATYLLRSCDGLSSLEKTLPCEHAHIRLLMEICERSVHWLYFHFGESCRDTFLGQPDARIERIAALYALNREARRALMRAGAKDAEPVNQHV